MFGFEEKIVSFVHRARGQVLEAATGLGRATGNVLLERNFGVKSGQGGARGSSAFCV